jgi:hypothetical protein
MKALKTQSTFNSLHFFSSMQKTNKLFFTNGTVGIQEASINISLEKNFSFGLLSFACYSSNGIRVLSHSQGSHSILRESKYRIIYNMMNSN